MLYEVITPEPDSHFNPNWISLHNQAFDSSCAACHTMDDPGGTSNTSFCSNSAYHGNVYTYAGFDAPALREILKAQLPPPDRITSYNVCYTKLLRSKSFTKLSLP